MNVHTYDPLDGVVYVHMVRDVDPYASPVVSGRTQKRLPRGSEPEQSEDLRQQARKRVEEMPAETALGHRDPEGGGRGEPADFESRADQQ